MTPREQVEKLLAKGFQLCFWPDVGDWKGPREKNWTEKRYAIEDYHDGDRVGIKSGVELAPGKFVVDIDIDYAPGVEIAKAFLPVTAMVWGRPSKRVSHCLYTTADTAPMYAYKDIGKNGRTLIEFRSAPNHQSMAPPSVWQKGEQREQLAYVLEGEPTHLESAEGLKHRTCLAAIGMLLAIHLGHNGFGHDTRLAWSGFLIRLGVNDEDLKTMGLAIGRACNNLEEEDVWRVIDSNRKALNGEGKKKVKGGPALAKIIGEHGRAVIARISEWVGRDGNFVRDQKGSIVAKSQENICRALEMLNVELTHDQFANRKLLNGRPMEDSEIEHLWFQIDAEYRFMPPLEFFRQKVHHLAWLNSFHPVKDYLRKLEWDGTPRVDEWMIRAAGVENTKYTRAVSSIMLIAAVKRIMHPGCKYDEMVVWESPQGIGKSTAAQALCPNPEWFSDDLSLNLPSQKLIEATLGKWIIEVSELAGKRKAEQDQLKAMLSRQVDGPARMAYAHEPTSRPRHFILIGTTNSQGYLADATGGRRWWPITVKSFDIEWIKEHRDQLWAEAVVREARGESIRLDEELWPVAAQKQEQRREVDTWEEPLRAACLNVPPSKDGRRRVTTAGLWLSLDVAVGRTLMADGSRLREVMQRLGFKRTTIRPPGEISAAGYIQERDQLHKLEDAGGDVDEEDNEFSEHVKHDTPF